MHFATKKAWLVRFDVTFDKDGKVQDVEKPDYFWFDHGRLVEGVPVDIRTSFSVTFQKVEGSIRFESRNNDKEIIAIHSVHGQIATIENVDFPVHPLTSAVHF